MCKHMCGKDNFYRTMKRNLNGTVNTIYDTNYKIKIHNGKTINDELTQFTANTLVFYVNGKEVLDDKVEPEWTLLWYLRNKLHLTGTKLGCAEGGCGTCTVMISKYNYRTKSIVHLAVNACLFPICAVHGSAVTTVEGIGSIKTKLHAVQERIAKSHGSQCGFCTPGIVMSMYTLLRNTPKPTMKDLEIAFQGNLCRCTGYRPIIEGYKTFTEEWEQMQLANNMPKGKGCESVCAMGDACCKKAFSSEPTEVFNSKGFSPYDPSQDLIFPPKLQTSPHLNEQYLVIKGKNVTWFRPVNLTQLLCLKNEFPSAKIVVGNTEVGIEMKFRHLIYPVIIQPVQVKELHEIVESKDELIVGASTTLNELQEILNHYIEIKPEFQTRIFTEIIKMLHFFGGKQIRNVAAIAGNIITSSPVSDLVPLLVAARAKVVLQSLKKGTRTVLLDENFFTSYRRNIVEPEEILVSVKIPFTHKNQYFIAYKQSRRRDDDIAIVNMAFNVFFKDQTRIIEDAYLSFGGKAPTTTLATQTRQKMINRKWDENLLETVYDSLIEECNLTDNSPGGMIMYRHALSLSLFLKGYLHISKCLSMNLPNVEPLPKEILSATECFHYKTPKSSQYFQIVPENQPHTDLIGRTIVHTSAYKQATGEAIYCDDMPSINGELYMSLVLSTRSHAKILKIDPSKALEMEGVEAFYSAKDIPDDRRWVGPIIYDDEIFKSDKVTSQGQVIGAVVAVDKDTAQKAARSVVVEYEDIEPLIVSIEEAIKHNSFFTAFTKRIIRGDANKAFAETDHIIEGEIHTGGQEHFYLETNAVIVVPNEEDELEIFSATQHPSEIQKLTAHALNIHSNRISVRVKRLGGGFGGKESRPYMLVIPAALAAYKLRKPVRCVLDRDEDMIMMGTRHPYHFKYKIGFKKNGLIDVVEIRIYSNAGYSADLSPSILERTIFHFDNSYRIPVVHATGYLCKTNLPSNTAFRGFGGPQAMFAAENMIRHIAEFLNVDVLKIAELNMYKEGDVTHYNQPLLHCTISRCWEQCLSSSNYYERVAAVQEFNKHHRYKKKGIAVVPVKFGISFTTLFLNQGGALVHIYTDGSVLVSHGGIEMGQGLHTKMTQVASRVLKVNPDKIHIVETATDKVPNTSATAASCGSDLNGNAVMNACNEIMKRLKPIIDSNPNGTWEDWVKKAYLSRISLSATGFYQTPNIGYSFETNSGNPYNYFTYGVACTEVVIDCLTGDHQILRTDIVMDVGDSLNPAIDIGQIEGAFTQGYGLFVLEELMYSPSGFLYSRGPGAYKLPGFADIPQEFNVSLLKGAPNPRTVYSSKAIGEPPLFLASSVFFAIKEAIKSARKDVNITGHFRLDSPATAARIRTACVDNIIMKIPEIDLSKQWNKIP
ncbi:xanthine dehydrogenase isoform X2 [Polistes fuscatus]|uniref:xanthine dehydrogenase isoform X2 n=1 Tax=Polistes fuscatus TaxID=30207 RepID=UPI001CA99A70|nr:xanthine dehydrogenase isoform X2 [Polistes fuscatus]